jgi:uncharacterized membrane protein YfcA
MQNPVLLKIGGLLGLMLLSFAQNVAFSLVSRSRNRNNISYHVIASICSNGIWFLTFRYLVTQNMNLTLFVPYTIGTVCGSVFGVKVSQVIERWLHAESDSHLNPKTTTTAGTGKS